MAQIFVGVSTPKRRRYAEPRYVGEICISDFETPRMAKISLMLVKNTVEKQTKKIRALQAANKRKAEKIVALKQFIKDLIDS